MEKIPTIVEAVADLTAEVRAVTLRAADGRELPRMEPGAHIDLFLAPGLTRQYSLTGMGASGDRYCIAVKREPQSRGGSAFVHDNLTPGDRIDISPPRNLFALHSDASPAVLLAGGIGVTPLYAMAKALQDRGTSFRKDYFIRSLDLAAFHEDLAKMGGQVRFHSGLDPEETRRTLEDAIATAADGTHFYICGPVPFMECAVSVVESAGVPADRVHVEYFNAAPVESGADAGFELHLAASGQTLRVEPGESILDVLDRAGITVDTSCEQGICGTCVTRVISGIPDHRDMYLTDAEKAANTQMCLCVSSVKEGPLVLDL
ncbi:oxidoreductase [Rhodospirillaceae bacterium KN72]|uniref:Oxidoreductase n=1 Tax=Pacificispira spongiicola TaxID=2729598 RepID=A0A7Y0DZV3_9PROT|nr:PDR/VanB family oxidoreductase [Pacificispira spongiicola]NMM44653.1 oxidoreductase [Pacificispira spongiicola]